MFDHWLQSAVDDAEIAEELRVLDRQHSPEDLMDRFGTELTFGTGGLRGLLGAGTNRMNIYTVRRATQGLADYLRKQADRSPVAIAYDSRINSDRFAREAARVLAGNGIGVWLYPRLMPTPCLSFAVRHLNCAAGIVITASHNPAAYNGYKVYGGDGCQTTPEMAKEVYENMQRTDYFMDTKLVGFAEGMAGGTIRYIEESTVDAYLAAVLGQSVEPGGAGLPPIHAVYTPLHGAGRECVTRVLEEIGVQVTPVPEQDAPDGTFPTCPFPNPEEAEALERGLIVCRKQRPDLLLGTDPDCDRLGIAIPHLGDYVRPSGNEVGVLLFDYICKRRTAQGTMPQRPVAVKTVVTTDMARNVAERYGVELRETLTGFKYIGEQITLLEQAGEGDRFLFGFEESNGYLAGTYARDKDAVVAALLVCEMTRYYQSQQLSLYEALEQLYEEYGYYSNRLLGYTYPGARGMARRTELMDQLRAAPPQALAGNEIKQVVDFSAGALLASGDALPPADMLLLEMEAARVYIRPSGTEPKIKAYVFTQGQTREQADHSNGSLSYAVAGLIGP